LTRETPICFRVLLAESAIMVVTAKTRGNGPIAHRTWDCFSIYDADQVENFRKSRPEMVLGSDRLLPVDDAAAAVLKKRTLTNLYNERPTWLANAHHDLDAAVAAAYGWPKDISEEDALARLLKLNRERAAAEAKTH